MTKNTTTDDLDHYAVKYEGGLSFARAIDEKNALDYVKRVAYDGRLREDDAEVIGPMSKEEADEMGKQYREKIAQRRRQTAG